MALTDNLIGVWCEAASPVTDESGAGETLTNNNAVGTTAGVVGTAGAFASASSQYLNHADDANLSTGDIDFTLALWAYATSLSQHQTPLSKRESFEFGLEYNTAVPGFNAIFGGNGISVGASNFGDLSLATWYHVVFWHDSVANQIGVAVNATTPNTASDTGGGFLDGNGTFNVGRDPAFGSYWDGRLNQVAMWKRVLTSAERTSLYNGGAGLPFSSWAGGGATAHLLATLGVGG